MSRQEPSPVHAEDAFDLPALNDVVREHRVQADDDELFRLADIAQQISYRDAHGQTTNEALEDLWFSVGHLDERCRRIAGLA